MGADVFHHLSIDIETYSDIDIGKAGLYKYAQSPAFEILLFAYSLDGGPVQVVDFTAGEWIPETILQHLTDQGTIKHAYNAAFEWYCLSRILYPDNDFMTEKWLSQWRCTMLHGLYLGYPGGLDAIGKALELPQDKQKLATGKALIRYFCKPCTPTKSNGNRTRNLPHHDPEKWALFKEYNAQDVVTEVEIGARLYAYPVPDEVQRQWETDQRINLRGVGVDMDLVTAARELDASTREEYVREAAGITGLSNPNSVTQLLLWLNKDVDPEGNRRWSEAMSAYEEYVQAHKDLWAAGIPVPEPDSFGAWTAENGCDTHRKITNLTKATVAAMLKDDTIQGPARRVLEIRQELGKTSNKKYDAIDTAVCSDRRVRGLLQFYGANRTGRWCLAEGSMVRVKTSEGAVTEKPIETVSTEDLVWDGCDWVHHDGVVFSGEKEVITWDGVTATPEHKVWVGPDKKVTLQYAMENKLNLWAGY